MDKLRLKYSVFTEEEICLPHFPFRQKNTYVSIYDIRTKLIAASTVIWYLKETSFCSYQIENNVDMFYLRLNWMLLN